MRRVLNVIARHVVVLLFALALSVVVCQFLGIRDSRDPRFFDISVALVIICLIVYHFRWLLGLKRTA